VLGRDAAEELVARAAGVILALRRALRTADPNGRAQAAGEIRDELRVGSAGLAGAVVEVSDVEDEREILHEICQEEEQRRRVGAARHRDDDCARRQQAVLDCEATHGVADLWRDR
jgi:hypothetical protein